MNYSEGELVARIEGTKNKKLYVTDNEDETTKMELSLSGTQMRFQPTFNDEMERQIFYIVGQSGSGKSYAARELCKQYHEIYKKRDVYLFSPVTDDKSLDGIKNLKKIDLTHEDFLSEPIEITDLEKSLVIFDDCESIAHKGVNKKIQELAEHVLERGRHHEISVVFISHTATNGMRSKKILNESHAIIMFLRSLQGRALKYLCESYLGMDKKMIAKIKSMKRDGRALCIFKTYPMVAITDRKAMILESD